MPCRQRVTIDPRTVRRVRFALALAALAAFGRAYLLSAGFSSEVDRATMLLSQGDISGLRDYILSFGIWAPFVSALLMALQALMLPLPAFVITFPTVLPLGPSGGHIESLQREPGGGFELRDLARFRTGCR